LVFLTVHAEEDLVATARAVGAVGYVLKSRLVLDLMHAVAEAHAGRGFVSALG
jgi:DNA-binding NarL/FixJ family response regulator